MKNKTTPDRQNNQLPTIWFGLNTERLVL